MQNLILYAICVLIWGSTWFVQKFQIGPVDPLLSISYRFALAAALMALFGLITGKLKNLSLTRRQQGYIALQGFLLFFLNYWLFYIATHHITSGLVAVCFSMISILNALNQRLVFKIPFRPQVVMGSILGVIGIGSVFWHEISGFSANDPRLTGIAIALIATYFASLGNMAAFRNSRGKIPVFASTTIGMGWGTLCAFLMALATGTAVNFDPSFHYIASLAYLAVFGSVIAFMAYLTLISRIGADRAGYVGVAVPLVALAISTFFEDYIWTWQAALGIAFILAGNVLALRKPKKTA